MTHPSRVALRGIETLCSVNELVQIGLQCPQFSNGVLDFCSSAPQQFEHVATGGFASVAQGHDAADLAQRQAEGLCGSDESDAIEYVVVVAAVAGCGSRGRIDQADFLVVAQRLRRHAGPPGDLADQHGLDLPVYWKPYGRSVQIQILYVPDCPNLPTTSSRLQAALQGSGRRAVVEEIEVASVEDAERVGMHGSPTILIDGHDPFASGDEVSLSCRLYRRESGAGGSPTVAQLTAVLSR